MDENFADRFYLFLVSRRQGHFLTRDVRFKHLEYRKHFEHTTRRVTKENIALRSREV